MLASSILYYIFYNNYNTTSFLHKVRPKAYLKVRGIKDLILESSCFPSFFPAMPQKPHSSTDR